MTSGEVVYGSATSLYVATAAGPGATDVHKFDTSDPARTDYRASGQLPGELLNQYSLSELDGRLRAATTREDGSESRVTVLEDQNGKLVPVGSVGGLGQGQRIYAVRFIGPVGYVVTFRQTDPLYTLDLSDPAQPRVRGAVALTGYSSYLHPASDIRLIGIGRQADAMGHVGGTQVSLFDVSDLAAPMRLATFALAAAVSDAEFDPHAFLYWPGSHLVVVPVQVPGPVPAAPVTPGELAQSPDGPHSGALVLRIDDSGITETGLVSQPDTGHASGLAWFPPIERSLIIGQTLWTISNAGALASDLTTLRQLAWIHFARPGGTAAH